MLKKLVKYDLIWINKFMLIYFIISLIVCTLTRTMSLFNTSFAGNIVYLILRGCAISCFVSCMINCVIRIWVRFRNNTYKDESYLTNTLPVTKTNLYNSKVISACLSLILTLIVIVICFLIVFLDKNMIEIIKNIFTEKDSLFSFILVTITAILEVFYMYQSGIIGILLGHDSNNNKELKSVFLGIILYFSIQILIMLIIYILGISNSNLNVLFTTSGSIEDLSKIKSLIIIIDIIYLIFVTIMYFIGKHIFNKGINVD